MFDHLPQNDKRIFSSISRKNSQVIMDKAKSAIETYLPLMNYYPNDVWDIMDINNRFVYANKKLNNIVGLNQKYDFEGRHMCEPPASCYDVCSAEFVEQNELCIRTRRQIEVLDIHPSQNDDWFVYIFTKTPVVIDDEVVATLHNGKDILSHWKDGIKGLQKLYNYYTGSKEISALLQSPNNIKDEDAEIIFFMLCQKEPKEIAYYLNITDDACRKRIQRLRNKLGVYTNKELVELAIASDFHKCLPKRLTGKQLSLILDH